MIKFSVYELEGIVGVFGCANGKGGDTADNKIVLTIYANVVHGLMFALTSFFVCKGEYGVYFSFAHDICVYLVAVFEMLGDVFGDMLLLGSFKTDLFCVIVRVGGFEHFLHYDRYIEASVLHCFYEKLWVFF